MSVHMEEAGDDGSAGGGSGDSVDVAPSPLDSGSAGIIDWRDGLADDMKDSPSLQDFKDVNGLAKAFMDTKSAMGKMVRLPTDEADAETRTDFRMRMLEADNGLMVRPDKTNESQMAEYYKSIGIPEESTPYMESIQIPDGMEMPESRVAALAEIAHKNNIPPDQFGAAINEIIASDAHQIAAKESERAEGINALKAEWSGAYGEKIDRVARTAELTGAPKQLVESIKAGSVGADTLRWLDSIATGLGSEGSEMSKQVGSIGSDTLEDTVQKRDELMNKMLNEDMTHVEYVAAQKRMLAYNKIIVGDGVRASSL